MQNARVIKFKQYYPNGFDGTVEEGIELLKEFLPQRLNAMLRATQQLEDKFGKIQWSTMKLDLLETFGRYGLGDPMVGANQIVAGVSESGETVQYRYIQPSSAESGRRLFKVGKKAWTPMSYLSPNHTNS